ncbi:hypothetical protein RJ639_018391 [Escallonia herrerae]|uniref:Rapid ALkalinization Factor n=1 Tax=Escallonia herrerae TaxID=1293975 RepID=A0AA88VC46_9ASTE|nr:hypothetical protein RJ639_018391 [Escallonia herrerae]
MKVTEDMETNFSKTLLHLSFLLPLTLLCLEDAVSGLNIAYTPCNGSIGVCSDGLEALMEPESRRFLEQKKYISLRDQPVFNAGASGEAYTKTGGCTAAPSNPYTRGCSKNYRCMHDSQCTDILYQVRK